MNQLAHVADSKIPNRFIEPFTVELAKQQWESAVDLLPQIICVLDVDGRILRINRTVEAWGLNAVEEARGLTLHQLLHPACSDPDCALAQFWEDARIELEGGGLPSFEADDPLLKRHVEIMVRPFSRSADDAHQHTDIFAIALIDDVTQARQIEARQRDQKNELDKQLKVGGDELKHAYDQLKELSAQLVNIQEQERKRIASELHDGIGQTLSIIKFGIEDARRCLAQDSGAETMRLLELLSGKMKGAIEEVRQITLDLRPSMLDDFGVIATISWFVREFQSIYRDITVYLEINIQEEDVPVMLKTAIYRILQEAMNNIAKHTEKATVFVRFGMYRGQLELAIEDSGAGFDVTQVMASTGSDKGYGLISMRDRARLTGGDYRIVSWAGQGTLIRVRWPVG